jgi:hypothetical protein
MALVGIQERGDNGKMTLSEEGNEGGRRVGRLKK